MSLSQSPPDMPMEPLADALQRLFSGEAMADIDGVSQEHLEVTYANSCDLLEREDFDGALELLVYLVMNDPYDFRFQFGYGLCLQHLGQAADAAKHYALACMLDPDDAGSTYRLGECHESLGDRESAAEAFQATIGLCVPPQVMGDLRLASEAALARLHG